MYPVPGLFRKIMEEGSVVSRVDKKTQFSPYVPIWLKEVVQGIATHLNLPMVTRHAHWSWKHTCTCPSSISWHPTSGGHLSAVIIYGLGTTTEETHDTSSSSHMSDVSA